MPLCCCLSYCKVYSLSLIHCDKTKLCHFYLQVVDGGVFRGLVQFDHSAQILPGVELIALKTVEKTLQLNELHKVLLFFSCANIHTHQHLSIDCMFGKQREMFFQADARRECFSGFGTEYLRVAGFVLLVVEFQDPDGGNDT